MMMPEMCVVCLMDIGLVQTGRRTKKPVGGWEGCVSGRGRYVNCKEKHESCNGYEIAGFVGCGVRGVRGVRGVPVCALGPLPVMKVL